jgi:hypothetical protein
VNRRRGETTKNSKQEEADSSQLIAGIGIGERRCSYLDIVQEITALAKPEMLCVVSQAGHDYGRILGP